MSGAWAPVLGVAWGAIVLGALAEAAGRRRARARLASKRRRSRWPGRARFRRVGARLRRGAHAVPLMGAAGRVVAGVVAGAVAGARRARHARRATAALAAEVPLVADLLAVATGSGATPWLALEETARWMPERTAAHFDEVRRAVRLGIPLGDGLRRLAGVAPGLGPIADALRAGADLGAPTASALVQVAEAARAELRRGAEGRARTLPVRLLFPLVGCVLPAFALLTVVPAVASGLARVTT